MNHARPRLPRPHRSRAFTFIELMFVIVVLGVLMAITLPRMGSTRERTSLLTAGRSLVASASLARTLAISHQRETQLLLDMDNRTWHIFVTRDEDTGKRHRSSRRDSLPTSMEQRHQLPERVSFAAFRLNGENVNPSRKEETAISFYPNGSSSGLQIELKTPKAGSLTVDIDTASGRAAAYRGAPKSLAARMREAGVDPSHYKGLPDDGGGVLAAATARKPGEGFHHIGRSQEDTDTAYRDAAARILGTVGRMVQKERDSRDVQPTRYEGAEP